MESEVADCCTTSKKPVAVVAPCRRLTHSSELDAATTSKHDDEQHPPATTSVPSERHFTTRLFLKMFIAINVPSVLTLPAAQPTTSKVSTLLVGRQEGHPACKN